MDEEDVKQIRRTLDDTIVYQEDLSKLIKQLIDENRIVTPGEKKKMRKLIANALLSQGTTDPVTLIIEGGWFTFASLQNMILRTCDLTTDIVKLETYKPVNQMQVGSICELWRFIYEQLQFLFPRACAEGFRGSKESLQKTEQGVYEFDTAEGV